MGEEDGGIKDYNLFFCLGDLRVRWYLLEIKKLEEEVGLMRERKRFFWIVWVGSVNELF